MGSFRLGLLDYYIRSDVRGRKGRAVANVLVFEVCGKFGEVSVESVDVVVDCDEVSFGVGKVVEAGIVDEVIELVGRDVEKHI